MGANAQAVGVRMELAIQLFCERTDEDERSNISEWLKALLAIRRSTRSDWQKASDAWEETRRKRILRRLLKRLADLAYAWGWRNRSWPARLGCGVALGTLASVGSQGAGIAALGGAIGLPLWIVLGAGGTFAGTLIQELQAVRAT